VTGRKAGGENEQIAEGIDRFPELGRRGTVERSQRAVSRGHRRLPPARLESF